MDSPHKGTVMREVFPCHGIIIWKRIHAAVSPKKFQTYIAGLVQDCSNSIANALELLQSCTKPSICVGNYTWAKGSSFKLKGIAWRRWTGCDRSVQTDSTKSNHKVQVICILVCPSKKHQWHILYSIKLVTFTSIFLRFALTCFWNRAVKQCSYKSNLWKSQNVDDFSSEEVSILF